MAVDIGSLSGLPGQHSFMQANHSSVEPDRVSISANDGRVNPSMPTGLKRNKLQKKTFPNEQMPGFQVGQTGPTTFNIAHQNLLHRLFPNGIQNCNFRQGNIGDCVLLAGLKATCQNNPSEIAKIITPGKVPGTVHVQFTGRKPVTLHETDFKKMAVQGDPGAQLLERAYGMTRKNMVGQSTRKRLWGLKQTSVLPALNSGKEVTKVVAKQERIKMPWMGLWNFIKMKDVQWEQKSYTPNERAKVEGLLEKVEQNPGKHAVIVSPRSGKDKYCQSPISQGLFRRHAYSLISANSKNRTVTLSNPHDSKKLLTASYDQFFSDFSNFHMTG